MPIQNICQKRHYAPFKVKVPAFALLPACCLEMKMSRKLKFGDLLIFLTIQVLFAFSGTVSADSSEMKKQRCRQTGLTLECNYFPQDILENVTIVRIVGWFSDSNCDNKTFQSNTWKKVKILEINDLPKGESNTGAFQLLSKCFFQFKELQELYLHSDTFNLYENTFLGLEKLERLDFSECARLRMAPLNKALRGPKKVPNLTQISLSNAGYLSAFLQLDEAFADALSDKPVQEIDASNTQITVLNITEIVTKIKHLKYVNVSSTKIGYVDSNGLNLPWQLQTIDVSYATLPSDIFMLFPGKLHLSNVSFNYNQLKELDLITILFSTKSLNFTGIVPDQTTIWFENVTVFVKNPPMWKVEEIILNKNNLRRVNCPLVFGNNSVPTLTKLGLSDNKMEFIHPSILTAAPNLQILDLSRNYLDKMARENFPLFETLLNSLKLLNTVSLSNNGLHKIPSRFFADNKYLEMIDLSHNNLNHVTFDLQTLKHLQVLNLSNNKIIRLDQVTLNNFNKLLTLMNDKHSAKLMINLDSNPMSCASCEDQNSIDWLLRIIKLNSTNQNLQCQQENGLQEKIHETTLRKLQQLCQRRLIILVTSVTVGFVFLVTITLFIIIYKRNKMMKQRKNRAKTLKHLSDGEDMYKFVAFLGYSSEDENFVDTYVINQMNETLKQITGIDRNLICTGDRYFRPGHMVHNEIATCLEQVCIMVVLVTNSYCSSVYCRSEFDQAHLCQKPIVLMVRGHVDEDMMSPAMKQLYRRNTRILWSEENGEYVLKTSWENVCLSILELIK